LKKTEFKLPYAHVWLQPGDAHVLKNTSIVLIVLNKGDKPVVFKWNYEYADSYVEWVKKQKRRCKR
jgi:hypothetical protein